MKIRMKNKLLVKYKEKKQNFGKCYGSKYYFTIYIYIYIYKCKCMPTTHIADDS